MVPMRIGLVAPHANVTVDVALSRKVMDNSPRTLRQGSEQPVVKRQIFRLCDKETDSVRAWIGELGLYLHRSVPRVGVQPYVQQAVLQRYRATSALEAIRKSIMRK